MVPQPDDFGLEDFVEPADAGLSLDELSQAYAAILKKGADPYPDAANIPTSQADEPTATGRATDEPLPVIRGEDDAACEITPRSILEAILFVGHPTGEPFASERIAALMRGVRPAEIDDLVVELNQQYEAEGAPYRIVSVGSGYQMTLRPEFSALRDSFYGRVREARLSQAAVDVLAIVAYHQPISIAEIDRLRGKPSGPIVAQLVRRDLLEVDRLADTKGSVVYRTTERFLAIFGLESLAELPHSSDLDR